MGAAVEFVVAIEDFEGTIEFIWQTKMD